MELVFAVPQPHPHPHQPNGAVTGPNETPTPLTYLASALNQAAKVLSTSSDAAAAASLRNAHQMIGSFLAQLDSRLPAGDEDEPMFDRREGEEEGDGGDGSRIIDEMEEGVRELVLPSKRRKRQVSPSWSLGRDADQGEELSSVHPMDRRRSSMDLVFQFHA